MRWRVGKWWLIKFMLNAFLVWNNSTQKVKMPKKKKGLFNSIKKKKKKRGRREEVFSLPSYYCIVGKVEAWIFNPHKISMWKKWIHLRQLHLPTCFFSCNKITNISQWSALGSPTSSILYFRAKREQDCIFIPDSCKGYYFNSRSCALTMHICWGRSLSVSVGNFCKVYHFSGQFVHTRVKENFGFT